MLATPKTPVDDAGDDYDEVHDAEDDIPEEEYWPSLEEEDGDGGAGDGGDNGWLDFIDAKEEEVEQEDGSRRPLRATDFGP